MKNKKSGLQKFSTILGVISFILSVVCVVFLYIKVQDIGMENPISASFLASIFFFCFIGVLFSIMGNSNIPSFRVDEVIDTSLKPEAKK